MSSKGCVLDLRMHDKKGTNVHDYSRYDNDGAVNGGAEWVEHGMRFDGSTGYLDCGNDESLNLTKAITISATIKTSSAGGFLPIVLKGSGWANVVYHFFLSSGRLRFRMNGSSFMDIGSPLLNDGVPHNVAITYANPGTVWLYVDGVPYDGGSHASDIGVNALAVRVGGPRDTYYFDGIIDQPRIFNRALTPLEIKRDYEAMKHKYV